LLYKDQIITGFSILALLYIGTINLIKKYLFTINRYLSAVLFISAALLSLFLLKLLNTEYISNLDAGKAFFALILLAAMLIFNIFLIYPDKKLKEVLKIIISTAIPGIILTVLTISTDLVISGISFKIKFEILGGKLFSLYILPLICYFSGIFLDLDMKGVKSFIC